MPKRVELRSEQQSALREVARAQDALLALQSAAAFLANRLADRQREVLLQAIREAGEDPNLDWEPEYSNGEIIALRVVERDTKAASES